MIEIVRSQAKAIYGSPIIEPTEKCAQTLWYPIGKHCHRSIGLLGIVTGQVDAEVMHPFHTLVHHELHGEVRALTGLEDHRTDGRDRRSTPLDDFDIRLLFKPQWLVPNIRNLKSHLDRLV